nr:hypothetical protein [Tanacetum cinerariifolium]
MFIVDIPENLAENDSIVAEHGLSSEITQSLVGAGEGRTLKLDRNSSNNAEGSPLAEVGFLSVTSEKKWKLKKVVHSSCPNKAKAKARTIELKLGICSEDEKGKEY